MALSHICHHTIPEHHSGTQIPTWRMPQTSGVAIVEAVEAKERWHLRLVHAYLDLKVPTSWSSRPHPGKPDADAQATAASLETPALHARPASSAGQPPLPPPWPHMGAVLGQGPGLHWTQPHALLKSVDSRGSGCTFCGRHGSSVQPLSPTIVRRWERGRTQGGGHSCVSVSSSWIVSVRHSTPVCSIHALFDLPCVCACVCLPSLFFPLPAP
ncbi:hypothetical protein MAPG_08112 [Magnaporthiopsis poae ATCC 64411]|uniref:Uncharacterized protein n=1 Tax=Magnaporthiopsis poae (strain ATCC 64411 / 73-15) TaxID=644358 RepID=A0A0C4E6H4_MAGP6|nr:hypothetical protein MAPG_08112 [Magnaporthiopsis poae ATCC 64411]